MIILFVILKINKLELELEPIGLQNSTIQSRDIFAGDCACHMVLELDSFNSNRTSTNLLHVFAD